MNLRPSGYEPDELPGCSTPRQLFGFCHLAFSEPFPDGRGCGYRVSLRLGRGGCEEREWLVGYGLPAPAFARVAARPCCRWRRRDSCAALAAFAAQKLKAWR